MSHYTCYIITAHGTEEEAQWLLAPYDQSKKVDTYDKSCYCIGRAAESRIMKKVNAKYPMEKLRSKFSKEHPEAMSEELRQILWERAIMPRQSYQKELLCKEKDRNAPDKRCKECKGTGLVQVTYNPHAKWDWYQLGGRWSRIFKGNAVTMKTLLKRLKKGTDAPYSFITPDGVWHAKGEMGWWGISTGDKEEREWLDECRAIFAQYPKHTVLLYDLHI
jgi:hypothetical protein